MSLGERRLQLGRFFKQNITKNFIHSWKMTLCIITDKIKLDTLYLSHIGEIYI